MSHLSKKGYVWSDVDRTRIAESVKKHWKENYSTRVLAAQKTALRLRGRHLSEQTKSKLSSFFTGRSSPLKGLSYEQIYGTKKAKEIKTKQSLDRKGRSVNKGRKQTVEECNKKSDIAKDYWTSEKNRERQSITMKIVMNKPEVKLKRLKQVFPTKDTSIETKLQQHLRNNNIHFLTHCPILGQPDIFIEPNICIFVDGCYWHACDECFDRNNFNGRMRAAIIRDALVTQQLSNDGYIIVRFWEHEINSDIQGIFEKIMSIVNKDCAVKEK